MTLAASEIASPSGPSDPEMTAHQHASLTLHEHALSASCVTSLVATSVSCWPALETHPAVAQQTPKALLRAGATTAIIGKGYIPDPIACVQYYMTTTSCGIGVHPQPTIGGKPTTVTIVTTVGPGASTVTSAVATTAAMSIGILDATLVNPSGESWNVVWSDEIRNKVVDIANSYCELVLKRGIDKRQGAGGAQAPGAVDRITCDMRTLEAGQQEAFHTQVVQEVAQDLAVEIPEAAVGAFVDAGLTTLTVQRTVAASVMLAITVFLLGGSDSLGTTIALRKGEMLADLPKVTKALMTTPTPTSTPTTASSSSSSTSSSSVICPACTACAPVKLNDPRGQMGASVPSIPAFIPNDPTITEAPDPGYTCSLFTNTAAPITFNSGPWCKCPDGRFKTGESGECPYTTAPPKESRWHPHAVNLRSASCDSDHGEHYGMIAGQIAKNVRTFCSIASKAAWNVPASASDAQPPTRTDKAYSKGNSDLSKFSEPTNTAYGVYDAGSFGLWPTNMPKGDRTKLGLQVKYYPDACEQPESPSLVDFVNTQWCADQFKPIYINGCPSTRNYDYIVPRLYLSGGKSYSDCMSWEIFMVGRRGKRLREILQGVRDQKPPPPRNPANGFFLQNQTYLDEGWLNSTWWNATWWETTAANSTFVNLTASDLMNSSSEKGHSTGWNELGWNATMFF